MGDGSIKVVVFDFDGVLSKDNTEEVLQSFSTALDGSSVYSRMMASKHLYECMMGKISFNEFKSHLANIADITPEMADEIATATIKARTIDDTVLNVARKLKSAGYILALHSDMMKVPFDTWARKFSLKDVFDHLICSAYVGSLKNNPSTYEKVLDFLGAEPGEVIYIDDSKANIYTAETMGLGGVLFRDAESLMRELSKRKLIHS